MFNDRWCDVKQSKCFNPEVHDFLIRMKGFIFPTVYHCNLPTIAFFVNSISNRFIFTPYTDLHSNSELKVCLQKSYLHKFCIVK